MEIKQEVTNIVNELSNVKPKSAGEIALAVHAPKWKVLRVLKRLENLGFLKSSNEIRFRVGRPRKLYLITPEGIKFFSEKGVISFEPTK